MADRPLILDLFCKAGGAGMGYHRAGFDVTGVDHETQKRYPFDFLRDDALDVLRQLAAGWSIGPFAPSGRRFRLADIAVVHASPPCQAFTQMSARYRGKGGKADSHPDLLTPTLAALAGLTVPWVVENVPGARCRMRPTVILHGGMFGLGVHRPRLFESNILLLAPDAPRTSKPVGVYGRKPDGRVVWRNAGNYKPGVPGSASRSVIRAARSLEEASAAMGIDWMTWEEIREAVPPAYTEFLGLQLRRIIAP